jgi:SAM-dependent methyltransferase
METRRKNSKNKATLTGNVFDEMGVYWAEISDKSQTEKQIGFLKNQLNLEGYILDLACGTGRHSIPLSKGGYNMVGLEVSGKLLTIAKQCWGEVQVVRGDMRFLPFKPKAFSAAISMDTSIGYLPSEKEDALSLAEVKRVVRQGGILIVDVFNRLELMTKYKEKISNSKWKEYPSFFLLQNRTVSLDGEWLCDLWTIRDKDGVKQRIFEHTVRLYGQSELEGLLIRTGFVINGVYGGYEGEDFSADSLRFILLANA